MGTGRNMRQAEGRGGYYTTFIIFFLFFLSKNQGTLHSAAPETAQSLGLLSNTKVGVKVVTCNEELANTKTGPK
jgi:hypothetical protein